jgi:hypothetical protein
MRSRFIDRLEAFQVLDRKRRSDHIASHRPLLQSSGTPTIVLPPDLFLRAPTLAYSQCEVGNHLHVGSLFVSIKNGGAVLDDFYVPYDLPARGWLVYALVSMLMIESRRRGFPTLDIALGDHAGDDRRQYVDVLKRMGFEPAGPATMTKQLT